MQATEMPEKAPPASLVAKGMSSERVSDPFMSRVASPYDVKRTEFSTCLSDRVIMSEPLICFVKSLVHKHC